MYRFIIIFFISIIFLSCNGKIPRKELPDLISTQSWETLPELPELPVAEQPFYTSDTTINSNGARTHFLSVIISNFANDSLLMNLVTSYEPIAVPMFEQWAKQNEKGILLDLRTGENNYSNKNISHSEFLIEKILPDDIHISIPIIFLWDNKSALRAENFMNALQDLPEVKCSFINTNKSSKLDCFSPAAPTFDGE
jgi:hypothetical protein